MATNTMIPYPAPDGDDPWGVRGPGPRPPQDEHSLDEIPAGTFHGGDEIPAGTFHGGDEIPAGTFHGGDEIPAGTFHAVRD